MTPKHTGIWAQTLVEALRKRGISDQVIVGNTGISLRALEGDEPKIGFDDLALLFERAEEVTGDNLLGFHHAKGLDYRRGGLITYTGVSSPTVRTCLHNLARYQRISGDAIELSTTNLDDHGLIEWHFKVPRSVVRRQYVEFGGTAVVDIIRRLTNRRVTPQKVEFRHFRKTNLKPISRFFSCTVEYGSDENRITLKQADLDLPLRSADNQLYKLLRKFSEEALDTLCPEKPSIVIALEERVAANPGKSQDDAAKELGMSTRTLSRRLTEAGTTYFGVVEAYREAMAKSMLAGTDMQFTEVAYVLGYADASTFSTAFKRWMGKTPSQYRGTAASR
ncbi:MAG: AraC family transcriptional regulator ligand-binding domain-containing protein [Tateyamaria sp.]|uniref:AraC family transcriptional regulator n=1 Tax=Tateyamaria sp. TaxID=1929288 RepID=UPI00329B4F87